MINSNSFKPHLPRPSLLRWEIAAALLIKIVLLIGLWFLIFRWQDRPVDKPDMAEHFALSSANAVAPVDFSSQSLKKEPSHVR
ncbi:MAG: hypothetical protein M0R33_07545 [Methylomonas sp.]|jgi:hypothetical protein|uniref:cytochrome oxidase putative small subunit CydP n=1 Tax=Methylomonas sp. TaxID=418 RepID=UPI0025D34A37|nr:cytochrome oxidase putative small subunit CydP [Methylomonas sp.]MCK9606290.1 hypothetical protein [Methylomonas sp.]